VDDVAACLTSTKKRWARDAGLDDSMCREVTLPTVKGYLQIFEDMPGEVKVLDFSRHIRAGEACAKAGCGGILDP